MADGAKTRLDAERTAKPNANDTPRSAPSPDPFAALHDRVGNRAMSRMAAAIAQPAAPRAEPLPSDVASRVESFTGIGLAGARVHTGSDAENLAATHGARALTFGEDIYLGAGESTDDARLLAHEATHVAQQASAPAKAFAAHAPVVPRADRSEREADQMENAVAGFGAPPSLTLSNERRVALDPINTTMTPETLPGPVPPAEISPTEGPRDFERNLILEANGHWYLSAMPYYVHFPYRTGANFQLWPINPNGSYAALRARCEEIRDELWTYSSDLLGRGDMNGWFARVYYYVTVRELEAVENAEYMYPHMKLQEVIAFYASYQANLDAWLAGNRDDVEAHWREAFSRADYHTGGDWWLPYSTEVLYSLLPAMQAHIRFDLPRAIAAVYVTHYAGIPGTSLEDFHSDFEAMAPVFDRATGDVRDDIGGEAWAIDPGNIGFLQDAIFPFIFSVPLERDITWEKTGMIAEELQNTSPSNDSVESHMRSSIGAAHPNAGPPTFEVRGENITGLDWLHQRGITPDAPGPASEFEPAPPPPAFPEYLYFKFDRPRADENLEFAIRDDQDLAPYRELALWTRQVRDADMQIVGHASSEGPDWYNENLAGSRAFLLKHFMWMWGADFDNNRMMDISFGEIHAHPVPEDRYAHITIWDVGTSRQRRWPPNTSLPSEVNTEAMRNMWLFPA